MLSDYCKKAADEYVIKVSDVVKIIPHLGNKLNYILDCRNCQLYLSLGMKLSEIRLTGTKNILILTLKKKKMLLMVLTFKTYLKVKRLFWIDDQFCLWENNGTFMKKSQCQTTKYTRGPAHITRKNFDKNYVLLMK